MLEHNGEFIKLFEEKVAAYCGAGFGVAVDSGTSALFLALKFKVGGGRDIICPKRTYMSVPMAIINTGNSPVFAEHKWIGKYEFFETDVIDMCGQFFPGMFDGSEGKLACLSFQKKKILSLGKGGMILTDDETVAKRLRRMAFDGRDYMLGANEDNGIIHGWHMNMTPDDAARGILEFNNLMYTRPHGGVCGDYTHYRDLTEMEVFKQYD